MTDNQKREALLSKLDLLDGRKQKVTAAEHAQVYQRQLSRAYEKKSYKLVLVLKKISNAQHPKGPLKPGKIFYCPRPEHAPPLKPSFSLLIMLICCIIQTFHNPFSLWRTTLFFGGDLSPSILILSSDGRPSCPQMKLSLEGSQGHKWKAEESTVQQVRVLFFAYRSFFLFLSKIFYHLRAEILSGEPFRMLVKCGYPL